MTLHLGSLIEHGELSNAGGRNSLSGYLLLSGERVLNLQLTGKFRGELAGQHIRFRNPQPPAAEDISAETLEDLANMQVGPTGEMELHVREDGTTILVLEWYGQNGHIRAELRDPIIAYGPEEAPPESDSTQGAAAADESFDFLSAEAQENPFELFTPELEAQWAASSRDDDAAPGLDSAESSMVGEPACSEHDPDEIAEFDPAANPPQKRPWDEVIPGIDPETKRMYEEWDEITEGSKDVPFTEVFDPPLRLKRSVDITSEAEAEAELHQLLARLALHCVSIHICDHYSALETYRLLIDDLLLAYGVHPNLKPTGFVQFYDTSEHCEQCEAEFEAEWKERHPEE